MKTRREQNDARKDLPLFEQTMEKDARDRAPKTKTTMNGSQIRPREEGDGQGEVRGANGASRKRKDVARGERDPATLNEEETGQAYSRERMDVDDGCRQLSEKIKSTKPIQTNGSHTSKQSKLNNIDHSEEDSHDTGPAPSKRRRIGSQAPIIVDSDGDDSPKAWNASKGKRSGARSTKGSDDEFVPTVNGVESDDDDNDELEKEVVAESDLGGSDGEREKTEKIEKAQKLKLKEKAKAKASVDVSGNKKIAIM